MLRHFDCSLQDVDGSLLSQVLDSREDSLLFGRIDLFLTHDEAEAVDGGQYEAKSLLGRGFAGNQFENNLGLHCCLREFVIFLVLGLESLEGHLSLLFFEALLNQFLASCSDSYGCGLCNYCIDALLKSYRLPNFTASSL